MIEERRLERMNEVVKELSSCVNQLPGGTGRFGKALAESISNEHRTLQQLMIGTLFEALVALGETDPNWTDPRNEASIEACRKLRTMVNNGEFEIAFPFI
jgi:hypothetical protein